VKLKIVSDDKTISALHRAKPRLSREAKAKAFCANSEAIAAPLTSSAILGSARLSTSGRTKALSAQLASPCEANSTLRRVQPHLSHEAKTKTPLGANNEAILASHEGKVLHNKTKFASKDRTKIVASPCKATLYPRFAYS